MFQYRWYVALFCIVLHITHWGLYLGNLLAIGALVAYAPWYYALPLCTILANPAIGGVHCLYNNLENHLRERLGWPLIEKNFLDGLVPLLKHLFKRNTD